MTTDVERAKHCLNRRRILSDIATLRINISRLERGSDKNFEVFDAEYLMVWFTENIVPMNHIWGLLTHYIILKRRLERVVNDDSIDRGLLESSHSPYHLKRFLDFNIQRYSRRKL